MVYSLTNCQFYHIAQESPDAIVLTKIQTQTNYLWLQSLKQLLEEGVLAIQKDNQFSVTKNFATEANLHKMAIRIFRESSIATPDSSETAIPSAPSEIISSSNFTIMSEEEKQGVLIAIEKELEKEGTILEEDQKDKKTKSHKKKKVKKNLL